MRLSRAVLLPLILLTPLLALAEAPVVGPDMNAYYHGADPARWRGTFEREGREVFDRRFEILKALQVQPGMRVADVGAGTGLYTLLFAEAVGPTGRVYAVDISESFVEAIRARAASEGLGNVVPVVNRERSADLPPASVDLVFLADTYHHLAETKGVRSAWASPLVQFRSLPGNRPTLFPQAPGNLALIAPSGVTGIP